MADNDGIKAFEKGGDRDISAGPLKKRSCTDMICILVFLAHLVAFGFVTFLGMSKGNPSKLFKPRDFKGGYCGLEADWNNGHNLDAQPKMTFMMNVSATVDRNAKQLACSSAAEAALRKIWVPHNQAKLDEYLCACCKSPCGSCTSGSLDLTDLSDPSAIAHTITGKMGELTNAASGSLFSPAGLNGNLFGSVWKEATRFLVEVCTTSCDAINPDGSRNYTYSPFPDDPLSSAWRMLKADPRVDGLIRSTINSAFSFRALPYSTCPYDSQYCVPFPGMRFTELADQCMFELNNAAVSAVGSAAASAYKSLGVESVANDMTETLGNWSGDFVHTLDAFALVAVLAFIIGLLFLVLLRFFVGTVVWVSILLVFLIFLVGGGFCHLRHMQCAGVGIFESGQQAAESIGIAAHHGVKNALNGGSDRSEAMSGDGSDYRGVQTRTRTGKTCQAWGNHVTHQHNYTVAAYPNAGLEDNYCRNPAGTAASIWCFTTDPSKRWDLCNPIGAINAKCPQGYDVQSKEMRKVLEILAFVIWAFALIWLIVVCCFRKQICLAIGLNKVAAVFVYNTPSVLLVPMCQALVGVLWCLGWAASAAFLLSQVPEDHVPNGFFATYAEAFGTDTATGKCTGPFVNGEVWKYAGNLDSVNDPCSGNMGNTTGISPACWGCYAPRYVVDWRFAVSFFSFLWNNAFLVALGQLIIAGACGVWFFAPREEKNKQRSVRDGVWMSFRYHLGSLAFGSLIIAVVQFVRYTLMYLEKQAAVAKNRVVVLAFKAIQCCLWCFEKCLKFLNKNAYIQIALLGKNFCTSAKTAFFLIIRNMARFGAVAMLGSIISFIGILFITVGSSVCGYFILKALHPDVTPVLPMAIYVVTAYIVAKLYMNVFGLAVDTMLQCFIATEEMGGDSGFVPSQLQSLVSSKAWT